MAKLLAVKTEVKIDDLVQALIKAWISYFGENPLADSVLVLVAQWALETGWGKSMYCYNLGNVKMGTEAGDCCYYACSEILSNETANRYAKQDPATAHLVRMVGHTKSEIRFYPENACCRFRAYRTLDEGALAFLDVLYKRFALAWHYVRGGDPVSYAHALKVLRYYTADEALYTKALVGVFNMLKRRVYVPSYSNMLGRSTTNLEDLEMIASVHSTELGKDDLNFDSIEC